MDDDSLHEPEGGGGVPAMSLAALRVGCTHQVTPTHADFVYPPEPEPPGLDEWRTLEQLRDDPPARLPCQVAESPGDFLHWAMPTLARPRAEHATKGIRASSKSVEQTDRPDSGEAQTKPEDPAPRSAQPSAGVLVEPLPIAPTRPVVTTAQQGYDLSREILSVCGSGGRSLAFCGPPGIGKTHAAMARAFDLLSTGMARVALLALPERASVAEKFDEALRLQAAACGSSVQVLQILGRGSDPADQFYCEEKKNFERDHALGIDHCRRCLACAECSKTPGRYLFDHNGAIERAPQQPTLIVTTIPSLPGLWRSIPKDAFVVIDDAGARFGLVRERVFSRNTLLAARSAAANLVVEVGGPAALDRIRVDHAQFGAADKKHKVPEALIARVLAQMFSAMLADDLKPTAFVDVIKELHEIDLAWIDDPDSHYHGLSFEGWDPREKTTRPALARELLAAPRLVLSGHEPAVLPDEKDHVMLAVPDVELIRRARAGRVVWLAVGPIPKVMAQWLDLDVELVLAEPKEMEVIRVQPRGFGFGGWLNGKGIRKSDVATRGLVSELTVKEGQGQVVAIVSKSDHEALNRCDGVGHYGAGHCSTNKWSGRKTLVARRSVRPYFALDRDAIVLSMALGLPIPDGIGEMVTEAHPNGGTTKVPKCELSRELLLFDSPHNLLNAAGRLRPLQNPGVRIVILDHIPSAWLPDDRVLDLEEAIEEFGLPGKFLQELELMDGRHRRKLKTIEAIREARRLNPNATRKEIAATSGTGHRTVERHWEASQPSAPGVR